MQVIFLALDSAHCSINDECFLGWGIVLIYILISPSLLRKTTGK